MTNGESVGSPTVLHTQVEQVTNPVKFLAPNLPYVLVPLLLPIRMRKPLPFTRKF